MSVFGEPIALPKLETPSNEDVDKWHAVYLEVSATACLFFVLLFIIFITVTFQLHERFFPPHRPSGQAVVTGTISILPSRDVPSV